MVSRARRESRSLLADQKARELECERNRFFGELKQEGTQLHRALAQELLDPFTTIGGLVKRQVELQVAQTQVPVHVPMHVPMYVPMQVPMQVQMPALIQVPMHVPMIPFNLQKDQRVTIKNTARFAAGQSGTVLGSSGGWWQVQLEGNDHANSFRTSELAAYK
jgi:hypothetical protein